MPWQRVEDISEYRLNTKKIDAWLKSKWGDYDNHIQVHLHGRDSTDRESTTGLYSFWSLEPKTKVSRPWGSGISIAYNAAGRRSRMRLTKLSAASLEVS